jgi:16S rRNA (cytosine967-C5)-methyltransferase
MGARRFERALSSEFGPSENGPSDHGLLARRAALALIDSALAKRGGLDEALSCPPFSTLAEREKAFARALAMTVLRRLGWIDAVLGKRLQKPPPDQVVQLLRIGVGQLLFMDTADHAAVSTTVQLAAEGRGTQSFKGLVNAVLRGVGRDQPGEFDPEALAPPWLFARWRAAYGAEDARAMAATIAEEPLTDLTLREASDADPLAEMLEGRILPGGTLRTASRGDLAAWPGYVEGRWWVQDASSAIPARLLAVEPRESVLDMCAAPGGKTLQLAAAGGQVVAIDRSASRLKRLQQNLVRTRLSAEVLAADAASWEDARRFDAILLDTPCTSTGAFRRHPDALWATSPADIAKLAQTQIRLIDSAVRRLRPGGRLVYCTCSLEPEEGESQVEAALRRHPNLRLDPISAGEGGAPEASLTGRGTLRILPHHLEGGTDGFFAARLVAA